MFSVDGAEIDDLNVIRDNDHLYFASKEELPETCPQEGITQEGT